MHGNADNSVSLCCLCRWVPQYHWVENLLSFPILYARPIPITECRNEVGVGYVLQRVFPDVASSVSAFCAAFTFTFV